MPTPYISSQGWSNLPGFTWARPTKTSILCDRGFRLITQLWSTPFFGQNDQPRDFLAQNLRKIDQPYSFNMEAGPSTELCIGMKTLNLEIKHQTLDLLRVMLVFFAGLLIKCCTFKILNHDLNLHQGPMHNKKTAWLKFSKSRLPIKYTCYELLKGLRALLVPKRKSWLLWAAACYVLLQSDMGDSKKWGFMWQKSELVLSVRTLAWCLGHCF